jgi:hypothetical protein
VEDVLLAENRLAASRHADDQVDGVAEETSVEDLVQAWIAAREALDQ